MAGDRVGLVSDGHGGPQRVLCLPGWRGLADRSLDDRSDRGLECGDDEAVGNERRGRSG